MTFDEKLLADFFRFAEGHKRSGDIDPTYPVMRALNRFDLVPQEVIVWRCFLMTTFDDLAPAYRAWTEFPEPTPFVEFVGYPAGTSRRGFRGEDGNRKATRLARAFVVDAQRRGGLMEWAYEKTYQGGRRGWDNVRFAFEAFSGNGEWASYKFADLLLNVAGYQIEASDIGVGGGGKLAGPVPGLVRLVPGIDWWEAASNLLLHERLLERTREAGVQLGGLDELETVLCDFNSLCKGRYYVGHDIDGQQASAATMGRDVWRARRESFPPEYLGELGGWAGVRKPLKRRYVDTGVI